MPRLDNEENRKHFHREPIFENDPKPTPIKGDPVSIKAYNSWYYRNHGRDAHKSQRIKTGKIARKRNKAFLLNYLLSHPCIDCGEKDPVVLEFDHRDRTNKDINIGKATGLKLETLKREIEKCDIRCANCHRRRTFSQLGWTK